LKCKFNRPLLTFHTGVLTSGNFSTRRRGGAGGARVATPRAARSVARCACAVITRGSEPKPSQVEPMDATQARTARRQQCAKDLLPRNAAMEKMVAARADVIDSVEEHEPHFRSLGAHHSCGEDELSQNSKRARVQLSDIAMAVEAIKRKPESDVECKKLYATVEALVESIGEYRKVMTQEEVKTLDEASAECNEGEGWIGYAIGICAVKNMNKIDEIMAAPVAYNTGDCVVCMEALGEEAVTITSCRHAMHTECLNAWLAVAPAPRCPLCVAPLARPEGHAPDATHYPWHAAGDGAVRSEEDEPHFLSLVDEEGRYNSLNALAYDAEPVYRSLAAH